GKAVRAAAEDVDVALPDDRAAVHTEARMGGFIGLEGQSDRGVELDDFRRVRLEVVAIGGDQAALQVLRLDVRGPYRRGWRESNHQRGKRAYEMQFHLP